LRKSFAFTPESLFTIKPGIVFIFIPECFSRSSRNPVHLAPESAANADENEAHKRIPRQAVFCRPAVISNAVR
jgi:hypothetical protein